jgi:hypothetical protein
MIPHKPPLSFDTILLMLLGAAQLHLYADEGTYLMYHWATWFLVWSTVAYLLLEWRWSIAGLASLRPLPRAYRLTYVVRMALIYLLIFTFVLLPLLQNLIIRFTPETNPLQSSIHDGAYQVELALEMVLNGQNPYVERFTDPIIADYMQSFGVAVNPAVDHYVYLPGITYLSIPFYTLSHNLFGAYDQRIAYITLFLIGVILIPWLARSPEYRLSLLIIIALHPLLSDTLITGMNDLILIPFLVGATLLFYRQRWSLSALCLGLACTLKQNIWFVVPFFLLAQWTQVAAERRWRQLVWSSLAIGLVMIAIIGPAFFSNPAAFYDDTIAYVSGSASGLSYPIRGYSLGFLLLSLGVIDSAYASFPFWLPQLLVGLPVLLALLWQQYRHSPTLQIAMGRVWFGAGLFILVWGILTRFFHHNYFGFTIILMLVGYVLLADEGGNGREVS